MSVVYARRLRVSRLTCSLFAFREHVAAAERGAAAAVHGGSEPAARRAQGGPPRLPLPAQAALSARGNRGPRSRVAQARQTPPGRGVWPR